MENMKRIKLTKNDIDMLDALRHSPTIPVEWRVRISKIVNYSVGYGYETKEAER